MKSPARLLLIPAILLAISNFAPAEELLNPDNHDDFSDVRPEADNTGPVYSTDEGWAGTAVIIMLGLFLMSAVIGPIVRAEMPDTVPSAMSHEEDPAVDRH